MIRPGRGAADAVANGAGERRESWLLLMAAVLVCVWATIMHRFRGGDAYTALGSYAVGLVVTVSWAKRSRLRSWFSPTLRSIGTGVSVGVVMTLATYPAFHLATAAFPALEAEVASLYAATTRTTPARALAWLVVIILAEELLWRGLLLDLFDRRCASWLANTLSITLYAAAQLGTWSWVVVLMAAVCGAIWTLQRRWTQSLLSPFIAHLIWTPVVIVLLPVR